MSEIGCAKHYKSEFSGIVLQHKQVKLLCFECITELDPSDQKKVISIKKVINYRFQASQMSLLLLAQIAESQNTRLSFLTELTDQQIQNQATQFEKYLDEIQLLLDNMRKDVHLQANRFIELRDKFQQKFKTNDQFQQIQEKLTILLSQEPGIEIKKFNQEQFENSLTSLFASSFASKLPPYYLEIQEEFDKFQKEMCKIITFETSQELVFQIIQLKQKHIDLTNKLYYEPQFKNKSTILKENIFLEKIANYILAEQQPGKQLNLNFKVSLREQNKFNSIFYRQEESQLNIIETDTGIKFGFCLRTPEQEKQTQSSPFGNIQSTQEPKPNDKFRPLIFSLKNNEFYCLRPEIEKSMKFQSNQNFIQLGSDLQINAQGKVTSNLGQSYELDNNLMKLSKTHLLGSQSAQIVNWEIFTINIADVKKQA